MTLNGLWLGSMGGQVTFPRAQDVILGGSSLAAFPWNNGFGPRYGSPVSVNFINQRGGMLNPQGDATVAVYSSQVRIRAFPWTVSGFGTQYTDPPSGIPGVPAGIAWAPSGAAVAGVHQTGPFVTALAWNSSNGFGTKYNAPSSGVGGNGWSIEWSATGAQIFIGSDSSSFANAYTWSDSTGFGTKFTNPPNIVPTTPDDATIYGVTFTSGNNVVAFGHVNSPYLTAYAWSSSGFGTRYSNMASIPPVNVLARRPAFSPANDSIVVPFQGAPYVAAYAWSNSTGFGTKFANPATAITANGRRAKFTTSGNAVLIGGQAGVNAYPWSGSGFGSKYADPVGPPDTYDITFTAS